MFKPALSGWASHLSWAPLRIFWERKEGVSGIQVAMSMKAGWVERKIMGPAEHTAPYSRWIGWSILYVDTVQHSYVCIQ